MDSAAVDTRQPRLAHVSLASKRLGSQKKKLGLLRVGYFGSCFAETVHVTHSHLSQLPLLVPLPFTRLPAVNSVGFAESSIPLRSGYSALLHVLVVRQVAGASHRRGQVDFLRGWPGKILQQPRFSPT